MKKRTTLVRRISRAFAFCLLVPALTFSVVSCSDDDDDEGTKTDPNEITDLAKSVSLTADQAINTTTLKFTANKLWEAAYENDSTKWFTFSPKSGNAGDATLTIEAPYNDGAAKTGKIVIKHGTNTYEVVVNQAVGKPDEAKWTPENLYDVEKFAPDAYNATEDMPAEFTFTVKTQQDYTTLEEAPFKIYAFYTDEAHDYEATDSIINWVEFKIADNSPVASEGKKITLTVKPHEEFSPYYKEDGTLVPSLHSMLDRYAFITIVPKETTVEDMFSNGTLKEEYKGASIQQAAYTLTHSAEMAMLGVGMPAVYTSEFDVTEKNFKEFGVIIYNMGTTEVCEWLQATHEGNHITLSGTPGHMGTTGTLVFTAYRGEELPPLELIHLKPMSVYYMILN